MYNRHSFQAPVSCALKQVREVHVHTELKITLANIRVGIFLHF